MSLLQSFVLPCFQSSDVPVETLLTEAKSMGYAAVETWGWDETLDELAATAERVGLKLVSVTGHESIDDGLNDPRQHDRIEEELRRSIDKASELGIPGVICFSGTRRPGLSDLEGLRHFAKGARRITPYAEEKGVNLNLEILNSRVDHPRYMADTVDWALAAVEMVGSPRLKVLFDVYHVQIMEGDIIRNLRKCMPHIGHVHTAGNPGRNELDDTQELNYKGISNTLREGAYAGYVGHEFFPRGERMAALRQAFEACA